jgi:hypothetical protein
LPVKMMSSSSMSNIDLRLSTKLLLPARIWLQLSNISVRKLKSTVLVRINFA